MNQEETVKTMLPGISKKALATYDYNIKFITNCEFMMTIRATIKEDALKKMYSFLRINQGRITVVGKQYYSLLESYMASDLVEIAKDVYQKKGVRVSFVSAHIISASYIPKEHTDHEVVCDLEGKYMVVQ
jgi:hypothetical protein